MKTFFSTLTTLSFLLVVSAIGQGSSFSIFDQTKGQTTTKAGNVSAEPADVQPEIHFDFDDPKEVSDTGKARVSVIVKGTESVPGHSGLAREFSGEDSKITIDSDLSKIIVSEYTVACWVQPHVQSGYGLLFESNAPYGVCLRLQGTMLDLNTGKTWHLITSERDAIRPEQWTHVAATCDGNIAKLYVNGKLIGEKEISDQISFGATAFIGQSRNTVAKEEAGGLENQAGSFLNGTIDDLRVYDVALNAEQVAALAK